MNYLFLGIDLIVLFGYIAIGAKISEEAHAFLKEPTKGLWDTPLFDPEKFRPEGELNRRRALQFWNRGLVVVIVYFVARSVISD